MGAMSRLGSFNLESGENATVALLPDFNNSLMYAVTQTSPVRVVKLDLYGFSRDSAITLNSGENNAKTASIDVTNGFIYVFDFNFPGKVVKIDLSTFSRDSNIVLVTTDGQARTSFIDVANGYVYSHGANATPALTLVKIELSTFLKESTLIIESGIGTYCNNSLIDEDSGFAYMASTAVPTGKLYKINLSSFTVEASLSLTGLSQIFSIAQDDNYVYVTDDSNPSNIGRVRKSDFILDSILALNGGESGIKASVIDTYNGYLYCFKAHATTPAIIKVNLTSFLRDSSLNMNSFESIVSGQPNSLFIDTTAGLAGVYIYYGSNRSPINIVLVDTGEVIPPSTVPTTHSGGGMNERKFGFMQAYMQKIASSNKKRRTV